VFSASPTLTGTLTAAGITASGPTALSGNLGFYGTSPIAKPSGSALTALSNLGLVTTPTIAGTDITSGLVGVTYGGTGVSGATAPNGSLLIGNGTGYSLATLTQGSGITITNSAGGITIAASAQGATGDIAMTTFSGANNVTTAANVTGLAFANASVRSFVAQVSVYIAATTSLYELFQLTGIQNGTGWYLAVSSTGDTSGYSFSITTAGQVQYTSTNVTGFTSGNVRFRAQVTNI
jgi:hypothetical protein